MAHFPARTICGHEMNGATEIEEQAAEWLARREGGDWSNDDQAAFDGWIGQSTANRIAVVRLETVWRKADRLRASDLAPSGDRPGEAPDARRRSMRWAWPVAIAASLAAVAIPGYRFLNAPIVYATPVGGYQQLPLADGSRVELNTNSELAVAFSGKERRVRLGRGEAFFKVAKDGARPFIVEAGDYRVVAVGTAFTVRLIGSEVDVVVTEGRVRIDGPAKANEAARPAFAAAGQAAVAIAANPVVRPVPPQELETALGWREGLLIFEGKPLGEVAAEFNRYNRRQLVVDPSAVDVVVDGTFRATNVDGFLRLLRQGFDVDSAGNGSGETVLRKKS